MPIDLTSPVSEPTLVYHPHDFLGEGPYWDGPGQRLIHVDMPRYIKELNIQSGAERVIDFGPLLSFAIVRASGGFVAGAGKQILLLDELGQREVLAEVDADNSGTRLNDGKCDPLGRLWAGTLSIAFETGKETGGALYRIEADGECEVMMSGITVGNGMGWNEAADTMYFIDSVPGTVAAFDFDLAAGKLSNRRVFIDASRYSGRADGLAVDEEGGVWIAFYRGGMIRRFTADGILDAEIQLPMSTTASLAFGGRDLETLYVTTGKFRLSLEQLAAEPLAGAVVSLKPGVRGVPVQCFAS